MKKLLADICNNTSKYSLKFLYESYYDEEENAISSIESYFKMADYQLQGIHKYKDCPGLTNINDFYKKVLYSPVEEYKISTEACSPKISLYYR